MIKKLKNCPFCGEQLQILGENHYYAHPTNGCILQHLCFEVDDKESIEAWNTRKPIEDQIQEMQDEIQELRIITGLMQKRKYYKKFVDEVWRRQEGYELSSPDADYIYKLYFELIEERDKFIEHLKEVSFVDIDEEYADDGQRMLFLHDAIEILKGGANNG